MEIITGLSRFEKDEKLCKKILFLVEDWRRTFPDVDLKYEFASAHQWLVMNNARYKDHSRFLFNWVKRAQNRFNELKMMNRSRISTKPYIETKPQEEVMEAADWKKLKEELVRAKVAARMAL